MRRSISTAYSGFPLLGDPLYVAGGAAFGGHEAVYDKHGHDRPVGVNGQGYLLHSMVRGAQVLLRALLMRTHG